MLALVPLAACSPYADAERDVAAGGRGLAKLNPAPKQAYELVLTLKDAPGPFAIVEGVAQYDVSNYEDCGRIIWSTGTASRITSQEPVELRRVGENEYRGTFYLDRMQDQDYYDRGTCHWTLTGVGAMLRATNGEADTRFLTYVNKERMDAGSPLTLYYPKTAYPAPSLLPTSLPAVKKIRQPTGRIYAMRCSHLPPLYRSSCHEPPVPHSPLHTRRPTLRHKMIPCLAVLLLTACHPETAMNQERAAAEADVAQGGRGLAKLNPSPRKAYELVLRLKDAPGDFAVVEGVAQYDVTNEDQCGHIEPATGTAARITSQEPVELRKVADGEYRGTLYVDRMLDEDYYGRGVCKWEFTGAGAMLKATGAEEETRFLTFADAEPLIEGKRTRFSILISSIRGQTVFPISRQVASPIAAAMPSICGTICSRSVFLQVRWPRDHHLTRLRRLIR